MADEAKDHDAISNSGNKPSPARAAATPTTSQIEEAVIVEEEIVPHAPAPKPPVAQAAPVLNVVPSSEKKDPTVLEPKTTPIPPVPKTPEPPLAPPISDLGLITKPPSSMFAPLSQEPQAPAPPSTDIAQILKDVQLPERRDQRGAADKAATPAPRGPEKAAYILMPISPSENKPEQKEEPPDLVRPVHTLKDDLQGVVHDQKMSIVRAVSLEEDRKAHEKDPRVPEKKPHYKRALTTLFIVALLFMVGGGAVLAVFMVMRRTSTPIVHSTPAILFAEEEVLFPLDGHGLTLKRTLAAARLSSTGTLGSITRIIPSVATSSDGVTQNIPATFAEFMRGIDARVPDDLVRALSSDFFFGLHTVDENAPLIIVPVVSYDRAFAGMLAWEARLNAGLAPAFTEVPSLINENGIPRTRTFQDLIMRNYDVRALKDDRGEIQLYYSFPTRDVLVIAESPYSFTEILSRLQAGRKLE